jgi:hypothetical protein
MVIYMKLMSICLMMLTLILCAQVTDGQQAELESSHEKSVRITLNNDAADSLEKLHQKGFVTTSLAVSPEPDKTWNFFKLEETVTLGLRSDTRKKIDRLSLVIEVSKQSKQSLWLGLRSIEVDDDSVFIEISRGVPLPGNTEEQRKISPKHGKLPPSDR